MSASVWEPGSNIINIDAESTNLSQVFSATAAQVTFTLTLFTYTVGAASIAVYRGGQRLIKGVDWNEVDSTHFSITGISLDAGEVIECVAVLGASSANSIASAASAAAASASQVAAGISETNAAASAAAATFPWAPESGGIYYAGGNVRVPNGTLAMGSAFSFRNKLTNGNLRIWQYGISAALTTGMFLVDRWKLTGAGTVTVAQSSTLESPSNSYALVWTTGSAGAYVNMTQYMPAGDVYALRGKTVTFSFYAKSTGGAIAGQLNPILYYSNSTDASASVTTLVTHLSGVTPAVSSTYQRFSRVYLIPADAVGLGFMANVNSSQASGVIVSLADFSVVEGTNENEPYETIPAHITHLFCQRFFEKSYVASTFPGAVTIIGADTQYVSGPAGFVAGGINCRFKVTKRAVPTVTVYSTTGAINKVRDQANGVDITPSIANLGDSGFQVYWLQTSASVVNALVQWTASAEL